MKWAALMGRGSRKAQNSRTQDRPNNNKKNKKKKIKKKKENTGVDRRNKRKIGDSSKMVIITANTVTRFTMGPLRD